MSKKCELCEKPACKKERYCPRHRVAMLRKMEADGYFVNTKERTVYSYERQLNSTVVGSSRFNRIEKITDAMDKTRDRVSGSAV